ncbi:MAG: alpha/beta hydrolase [Bacteroidota bacterium]
MSFQEWEARGKYYDVFGHKVFAVEAGQGEETIVVLHGYPTCSYDYLKVLPLLSQNHRVVVHDHLGFGLSDKPINYSYSLIEQADIALELWRQLGIEKAHVLAHDYGTSVATELIARRARGVEPMNIQSSILSNGSMLIHLSQLRPIQKLLKNHRWGPIVAQLSTEKIFLRNMRKIWGDPDKIDLTELKILWQMLLHKDGRKVLSQLTQYINERYRFWHRWVGSLYACDLPIHILWATEDPVAVVAMAHELHKNIDGSSCQLLEGVGHYPMIEAPQQWAGGVLDFIAFINKENLNHKKEL